MMNLDEVVQKEEFLITLPRIGVAIQSFRRV
jgi:hypothetical protein